jgi:hypothetical protein
LLTLDELSTINTLRREASTAIEHGQFNIARKYLHACEILTMSNDSYSNIDFKDAPLKYTEPVALCDEAWTILNAIKKYPSLAKSLLPGLHEIQRQLMITFNDAWEVEPR